MDFLTSASTGTIKDSPRSVQVVLSTHSPNLASSIPLENLILLDGDNAYSLAKEETNLAASDYAFLERFLDVTKANLFFAHGVVVVEGDAEALLIPILARLLNKDLTEHGVSIVNVGGTGLRRFSRIFQRSESNAVPISVRVACLADMDVMPNCAPEILGLVTGDDDEKWTNPRRRWKATRDLADEPDIVAERLAERRKRLQDSDGAPVRTFVSDHWTLEYDLAYCGLAEEVFIAATLAANDEPLRENRKNADDVTVEAKTAFAELEKSAGNDRAVLCSHIYKVFKSGNTSKAVAAQYLASLLTEESAKKDFDREGFSSRLPRYIVDAIEYATSPDSYLGSSGTSHLGKCDD